jgi:hypothetical protein
MINGGMFIIVANGGFISSVSVSSEGSAQLMDVLPRIDNLTVSSSSESLLLCLLD